MNRSFNAERIMTFFRGSNLTKEEKFKIVKSLEALWEAEGKERLIIDFAANDSKPVEKELTVKIGADTSELTEKVEALKKLYQEVQSLLDQINKTPIEVKTQVAVTKNYGSLVDEQERKKFINELTKW